jgi:hypothetical protein
MSAKSRAQAARFLERLSLLSPKRAPPQGGQDSSSNTSSAFDLIDQIKAKGEDLKVALRKIGEYIPKDRGKSLNI